MLKVTRLASDQVGIQPGLLAASAVPTHTLTPSPSSGETALPLNKEGTQATSLCSLSPPLPYSNSTKPSSLSEFPFVMPQMKRPPKLAQALSQHTRAQQTQE